MNDHIERCRITISFGDKYAMLVAEGKGGKPLSGDAFRIDENPDFDLEEGGPLTEMALLHDHIFDYLNNLANPPRKGWIRKPRHKKA